MCANDPASGGRPPGPVDLTRRRLLAGTAATAAGLLLIRTIPRAAATPTAALGDLAVVPRSAWGADLPVKGTVPVEDQVRYLLVHHSVDPGNTYGEGDVAGILRSFYRYHTGADKGWPDLAYNFMVDRFGRVWEGRTGSLAGPVAGDATGGNQGSDQLCCFIGNHQQGAPSPEAVAAMGRLLGALGRRYGVSLEPEATTVFVSRGSNRHPAGTSVTTPTITGHRAMSLTECPGDLVVTRIPELRSLAAGAAGAAALETASTTTVPAPARAPSTTARPTTSTTSGSTTTSTSSSTTSTTSIPAPPGTAGEATPPPRASGGANRPPAAAVGGGAAAVATAAYAVVRVSRRPHQNPKEPPIPDQPG